VLQRQSENPDENDWEWQKLKARLHRIFSLAHTLEVPILIDAEESWLQPAIDRLAEAAFLAFNREHPIVYTTLQMYRKDRLSYLHGLWQKAENEGFFPGIKLVRGAYMEKERLRAAQFRYPDPIQSTKADTDRDFNLAVDFLVEHIQQGALVLGTHNEESCLRLVSHMQKLNLKPSEERIYFSQLLGMSDHISFNLAEEGFQVAKYVPYGPVAELLPYLQRRAAENTSVKGQTGRELALLYAEFKRRKAEKTTQKKAV
jgi:proline dehydrogenase